MLKAPTSAFTIKNLFRHLVSKDPIKSVFGGDCVPSARQPRSWEKEACKAGDTERFSCSSEGKITCVEGWIGDLCQVRTHVPRGG